MNNSPNALFSSTNPPQPPPATTRDYRLTHRIDTNTDRFSDEPLSDDEEGDTPLTGEEIFDRDFFLADVSVLEFLKGRYPEIDPSFGNLLIRRNKTMECLKFLFC